jgi:hypothetical protein
MEPTFWKLSMGNLIFGFDQILRCIHEGYVAMHKDTNPLGTSKTSQALDFASAKVGDYFYLTYGNEGVYMLGQFTEPVRLFNLKENDWMERSFKAVKFSDGRYYEGDQKWWTPNHNSTFCKVPQEELPLFEELILRPFFGLRIKDFKIK